MNAPENFVKDFQERSKTELQQRVRWRERWAGRSIRWDNVEIYTIGEIDGQLNGRFIAKTVIQGETKFIAMEARAPLERAAEFARFSANQTVVVSGMLADELIFERGGVRVVVLDASLSSDTCKSVVHSKKEGSGCMLVLVMIATLCLLVCTLVSC